MKKIILLLLFSNVAFGMPNFVTQTNIFVGEVASNLTLGAPLYVDANGKIAAGEPATTFVGASTNITVATSASYATITSLSISPTTAGTYQVHCRIGSIAHTTNNAQILMAVFNNGTIVSDSIAVAIPFIQGGVTPSLSVPQSFYTNSETTITAGQSLSCGWRTTSGTAQANDSRSILINRIR